MQEIANILFDWKVVIPGAIGSAIFAAFLYVANRIWRSLNETYSAHSSASRRVWLVNEMIRLNAVLATTNEARTLAASMMVYRASRPALKALVWLAFGLLMNLMFNPAGIIGYVICIFYLIRAYSVVAPVNTEDPQKKLDEVLAELNQGKKS